MGCAASKDKDPYVQLLDKYGDDKLQDFTVSIAKVQFIESSKDQIVNTIKQNINKLNSSLIAQVQSAKVQIDKKYERSLHKIQQADSKAIGKAQKMFKVKIDEVMGYKDVIKKYQQYNEHVHISLQNQQSKAMSELKNTLKQYEQQLKERIPQLKKYNALDEDVQQNLLKTAKKKFKSSIQKGISDVQVDLAERFNFQNFKPKFNSIVTKDKLNQLLNFAQKVFMTGQEKVKGASDCKTC